MAVQDAVIVVGAGLAGLSAARLLTKHNVKVIVLEAKDRVGGRTLYDPNYDVDLGGTFVGADKKRSLYIANQLEVERTAVPKEGLTTFSINNEVSHIHSQLPNCKVLKPLELLQLYSALLYDINMKASDVPVDEPWKAPLADRWDHMTTEQWIKAYTILPKVRTLLRFIVQVLLGVEPSEISFLYFLWYIRVGHGFPGILTNAQDEVFVGGAQQLSEKMAEELGDQVHLGDPVVAVNQSDSGVIVSTAGGKSFNGSYCILAITPGVRGSIQFTPLLNGLYHQFPQRMPMGSIVKTFAFYDSKWWRTKGYNGIATVVDGCVGQTYDVTQPGGKPCIMGFVLGKRARQWQLLTSDQRKEAVLREYERVFESSEALNATDYIEKDWLTNVHIGGSGGVAPCGVTTTYQDAVRKAVGRYVSTTLYHR